MSPCLPERSAVGLCPALGGDERVRTDDPLLAKQVLSQLSYTPPYFRSLLTLLQPKRRAMLPLFEVPPGPSKLNNDPFKFPLSLTLDVSRECFISSGLHRKEVIQPHLPIRLPCYDFTPSRLSHLRQRPLAVRLLTSGVTNSHGVTGGVYKARERIHRGMLIRDY